MTDNENNIHQFPGTSNQSTVESSVVDEYMDLINNTNAPEQTNNYQMAQVLYTPEEPETVPDIASGGSPRNRRWGAICNVAVVPNLDKVPPGNITLPNSPVSFISADSVEELRARLLYEVEKSVRMAELMMENPGLHQEVLQRIQSVQ